VLILPADDDVWGLIDADKISYTLHLSVDVRPVISAPRRAAPITETIQHDIYSAISPTLSRRGDQHSLRLIKILFTILAPTTTSYNHVYHLWLPYV
jgi:hypothetical protein